MCINVNFWSNYGLFLAKIVTLVTAMLFFIGGVMVLLARHKAEPKGSLTFKKLNEKYQDIQESLNKEILSKKEYKKWIQKQRDVSKKNAKNTKNKKQTPEKSVYVLTFEGDVRASAVDHLREEITAVLSVAQKGDEVICLLESAGGMVHSYGLAASQLQRIKDKHITLTVIIDKVAASGGYLMACVADKIIAAPFAIIGSIGVIAQLPNFNRLLKKNDIDFEQVTAGEYKRTLTVFGENTEKAREKMKESLEEIHYYFKTFITQHRPQVDIDQVSTGEHWLAYKALQFHLIDQLQTSDDYLWSLYSEANILEIQYHQKKSFTDKCSDFFGCMRKNIIGFY